MALSRRQLMIRGSAALLALSSPPLFAASDSVRAALAKSQLIYLTPLHGDGRESTCQGEVWYVEHDGDLFVSTRAEAWRSRAISNGRARTRIWIGEFGPWRSADGAYRSAPQVQALGSHETDAAVHGQVLEKFGNKYAAEWDKWGPRFHDGLADGSRVMLRYAIEN